MHKFKGFTLVELVITVTIIAIIVAIALPSYQQHVRKTKRAEAQSKLLELAGELQQYKVVNHTFKPKNKAITLADLGYTVNGSGAIFIPDQASSTYRISLQEVTTNSWLLVAMTQNGQKGDGSLGLDSDGMRCWTPGDDLGRCTPNSASSWEK
jgi:type IV pilus assembly protein PilE